jgi:hypothetical protein
MEDGGWKMVGMRNEKIEMRNFGMRCFATLFIESGRSPQTNDQRPTTNDYSPTTNDYRPKVASC